MKLNPETGILKITTIELMARKQPLGTPAVITYLELCKKCYNSYDDKWQVKQLRRERPFCRGAEIKTWEEENEDVYCIRCSEFKFIPLLKRILYGVEK